MNASSGSGECPRRSNRSAMKSGSFGRIAEYRERGGPERAFRNFQMRREIPVFIAVLLLVSHPAPAEAGEPRPNILFIVSEDISRDLGCYGNGFVHTPNLDRLASQGARFTRCFTHAPVCAPSRSGMITGMYP